MKKQIITILLTVLALSGITAGIAYASDISDAIYFGKIRATNNSTATENVSGVVTINGTAWIANGLMQSDASDIVVVDSGGSDTAFMPGTSGADWVIWMDTVPAGNQDLTIYTGATGGKMRTFFDTAGMDVADDASLEMGDNFTLSASGYLVADNGTQKHISHKPGAYKLYISDTVSGNVTFDIFDGTMGTEVLDPTAEGDETGIASSTGANHWSVVADASDASYVFTGSGTFERDLYEVTDTALGDVGITSIVVTTRVQANGGTCSMESKPVIKVGGTVYEGTVDVGTCALANETHTWTTNPSTGSAWQSTDLNDLQAGVSIRQTGGAAARATEVYVTVNYANEISVASVSATGVSTGEHTVLAMAGVSSNTSDYTLRPNGAGSSTALTVFGAAANWQAVDEATADNETTYVRANAATYKTDTYALPDTGMTTETIQSVNLTVVTRRFSGTDGSKAILRTHGTDYEGTEYTGAMTWTPNTDSWTTNPATGLPWTWAEIDALEAGVALKAPGVNAYCTQVYVTITYSSPTVEIWVDGVEEDEDDMVSIPDNSIVRHFFENGVMPYTSAANVTIDGILAGGWDLTQYYNSTSITDQSGNGNTGTATYRTTSSDSDVTMELISFQPISKAQVDGDTAITWPAFADVDNPPSAPDTTYTENSTPGLFFAGFIHSLWTGTGASSYIPVAMFWYIFAFSWILGVGILIYWAFASSPENRQSALFIKIVIMTAIMTLWALPGPNIYGLYVVVYSVMFNFGILVLSKSYGW